MLAAEDTAATVAPSIAFAPALGSVDDMVYCFLFSSQTMHGAPVQRKSLEQNKLGVTADAMHITTCKEREETAYPCRRILDMYA